MTLRIFTLAALLLAALPAAAHDYKAGALVVDHPFARATAKSARTGAAYMTIENKGTDADRLLGVASPRAGTVELHTMAMDGDIMRSRQIDGLDLPPGAKVAMQPGGGPHVMLIGLKGGLSAGEAFPLTLEFAKAGKVEVSVQVEKPAAGGEHRSPHSHSPAKKP